MHHLPCARGCMHGAIAAASIAAVAAAATHEHHHHIKEAPKVGRSMLQTSFNSKAEMGGREGGGGKFKK